MRSSHALMALAGACALGSSVQAEVIYGLLNNDPSIGQQLVTIDSTTRAVTSTVVLGTANTISPLASIDVRPATGQLYGFDATARQLVIINPSSGALTPVGSPLAAGTNGTIIDFNPTVDRIRLLSFDNQNFRVNPDTAAVTTDGSLAYAAGDSNAGDTPNIRGAAYTNSVAGATTTTLYDIDVNNDVLVSQAPPNDGTLNTIGTGLGVDLNTGLFGTFNGFDISGSTGLAYLTDGAFAGPSNFYTVNLGTGAATSLGAVTGLPAGRTVADIAVANVPEPTGIALIALGGVVALRRRK